MALNHARRLTPANYLDHKTLIVGGVNCGKTRLTAEILHALYAAGWGPRIVVLDLAPEPLAGIGGKLAADGLSQTLWLTATITAPRLTGRTPAEVLALARRNAVLIEPLLEQVLTAQRTILLVNDASLYLQAGRPQRFKTVLAAYPSVIANAYYGDDFPPAAFTRAERRRVASLARWCDRVLRLNKPAA